MNWNAGWTHRKQKEMVKKAVNSQTELKPIYPRTYTDSYLERRKMHEKHDKFCWRVGFVIIALMMGLLIWAIIGLT